MAIAASLGGCSGVSMKIIIPLRVGKPLGHMREWF